MQKGHTKAVDWWSLGCLIYEMLSGYPPFSSQNRKQLYNDILKVFSFSLSKLQTQPVIPSYFSQNAKDLIVKLMTRDPVQRLGANGAKEIMEHPFFQPINWDDAKKKNLTPPYMPHITKPEDTRNFDRVRIFSFIILKMFTDEKVMETPSAQNDLLKEDPRNKFENFTYVQREGNLNQSYSEDNKMHFNFGHKN